MSRKTILILAVVLLVGAGVAIAALSGGDDADEPALGTVPLTVPSETGPPASTTRTTPPPAPGEAQELPQPDPEPPSGGGQPPPQPTPESGGAEAPQGGSGQPSGGVEAP